MTAGVPTAAAGPTAGEVADRRDLPPRPTLTAPRERQEPPSGLRRWQRQPLLGLAGLTLVAPVAVLLAVGAGGAQPSLRVFAPLVTFALPVVAMIAFWWADWPGTRLASHWSGWADTVLVAVAAVLLTVLGQAVVLGRVDLSGVLDPSPGQGSAATFPATLPLAGAAFIAMLQLTLASEGWPLRRLGPVGACAVAVSWAAALVLYVTVLGRRPFSGSGPDPARALLSGEQFGALLTVVGGWQVGLFVAWRGWPVSGISRRWSRLLVGNAVVLTGAALTDLLLCGGLGLPPPTISALAGCFVAASLLVGMLFEGAVRVPASDVGERGAVLALVLLTSAGLYALLHRYPDGLSWSTGSAEDWVSHAGLNAIGVGIILHVAIGRRWPFARPDLPP